LLLDALDTLYGDGPKSERDRAYMRKMEQLAARFPEDQEIQLFYALSVFGVQAGVRDIDSYMLATAISDAVFAENPQHPGAAHYLIHGVDDPVHAVLGLRAARALGSMAPDAAHAQHMTAHIYTALGMWDDVVIANEAAVRVRNEMRAESGEAPSKTGHYNAWLIYGYLQQGRVEKAGELLDAAYAEAQAYDGPAVDRMALDPDDSVVGSAVEMWMRYLIETGDWDGERADWSFRLGDAFGPNLDFNFVQAMRAANASLSSNAQEQLTQFQRLRSELATVLDHQDEPSPTNLMYLDRLEILEQEILAKVEEAKGQYPKAIAYAREASRLEGALPRAFGPPFITMPSAQLLGDLQLAAGEYRLAAEAYTLELERNRQRTAALSGLIRSQSALGNETEANYYRNVLGQIWHLADVEVRASMP
jgi:tetratricopeptide (TPR) repeat protein